MGYLYVATNIIPKGSQPSFSAPVVSINWSNAFQEGEAATGAPAAGPARAADAPMELVNPDDVDDSHEVRRNPYLDDDADEDGMDDFIVDDDGAGYVEAVTYKKTAKGMGYSYDGMDDLPEFGEGMVMNMTPMQSAFMSGASLDEKETMQRVYLGAS